MEALLDPTVLGALLTLTVLEIVLGIDNIVFITIISDKVQADKRALVRRVGIVGASVSRIAFLCFAGWILSLDNELFTVLSHGVSGHDLVLIIGGLFLLGKATHEIYARSEGDKKSHAVGVATATFASAVAQIMAVDFVFSIDSVITAVGMTEHLWVMISAVLISVSVMLAMVSKVVRFIDAHPSIKLLALSFLLLIGTMLVAEGLGQHIPKGYIYFAMAFSVLVEMLDIRTQKRVSN
ncbi:MAG: TerC family protein [Bacteroidota bacterium]